MQDDTVPDPSTRRSTRITSRPSRTRSASPLPAVPAALRPQKRKDPFKTLLQDEGIYKDVLTRQPGTTDAALKNFEGALIGLGKLLRDQKRAEDLADLIRQTRTALSLKA